MKLRKNTLGRFAVLRSRLASHGVTNSDDDANLLVVYNLSFEYKMGESHAAYPSAPNLTRQHLEKAVKDAHADMVSAREGGPQNGAGHAFVAAGGNRGDGRVQNGSSGNGGGFPLHGTSPQMSPSSIAREHTWS